MARHLTQNVTVPLLLAVCLAAAAQEPIEVRNIEYLEGVPGQAQKSRGALRISPNEIIFVAGGKPQFTVPSRGVDYVAAQAQAGARTRTRETGMTVVGATAIAIGLAVAGVGFAGPAAALFLKREKHLLSIEYLEGEDKVRDRKSVV